ncbi:hypothetical protein NQZ68_009376 [Dissostichus eleginoides]|nr:hypothetical protein NQZ68_009376 [Dissostichus eleginoides]
MAAGVTCVTLLLQSHDSQWVPSTQLYRAAVVQTKNYGKSENNVIWTLLSVKFKLAVPCHMNITMTARSHTTMPHHGQIYHWLATDYNHLHAFFVVVNINSCP